MDVMDKHESWVKNTRAMLTDRATGPGRHVWDRLARLLQYAEVKWVDGELLDASMRLNGTLLVFTDLIVAIVELKDEERRHDHGLAREEGVTNVQLVPRSGLEKIDVLASETDRYTNAKWRWLRLGEHGTLHDDWPMVAPITLRYRGGVTLTVNGPLRDLGGADMSDFMETLLRDLAA
ncbi:hypothetical protein [Ornithinimicrobium cryptoxanthini]|uniref:Uncharacterized protein n=1 Tax=Ornithinimicrobium cryptoxanthini TaxID=2934161 RepID=A0ABY4YJE3_9MICO|nr:hypothetical protein [Ornithinimicrobium cryptoxanthini]USQ76814.1 hypothetical protein NF557_02465 [Ornithinimicrobium cryptoxanthini]